MGPEVGGGAVVETPQGRLGDFALSLHAGLGAGRARRLGGPWSHIELGISLRARLCPHRTRAKHVNDIPKIGPPGRRDPLLLLAEVRELRREQRLLLEETAKVSDRLNLVSRAALAGCILLSLELILDLITSVLRVTP